MFLVSLREIFSVKDSFAHLNKNVNLYVALYPRVVLINSEKHITLT